MRKILLLTALVASSSALFNEYKLSDANIQIVATSSQPSQAVLSPCLDINWNACQGVISGGPARFQYNFNNALGLNTSLNYKTGTEFFNQINALLNQNIQGILNVCKARTSFYQCLGSSYYSCMSLFNILQRPNVDYQNAFDYSRSFLDMEFMCTAGFETVVTDWGCIVGIPSTLQYTNCLKGFNELLPPDQLCPSVKSVGQCLFSTYQAACVDNGVGFYGCENFRVTFDQTCYGVRCDVPQN